MKEAKMKESPDKYLVQSESSLDQSDLFAQNYEREKKEGIDEGKDEHINDEMQRIINQIRSGALKSNNRTPNEMASLAPTPLNESEVNIKDEIPASQLKFAK